MAEEQEIDKLSLSIEISDNTQEGSENKVKNLANAIRSLNNAISKTDISKIDNFFLSMSKSITPLTKRIEKVSGSLEALGNIAKAGGLKKVSEQLKDIKIETDELNDASGKGGANPKAKGGQSQKGNIDDGTSGDGTSGTSNDIRSITSKYDLLQEQLKNVRTRMQNNNLEEEKLLSLKSRELTLISQIKAEEDKKEDTEKKQSKLLQSITRVATYRIIRAGLKEITQSISQSLDAIAMFDKGFRGTMSNVTSSLAQVKASVGVALYQGLIILEPIITAISSTFVGFANSISYVTASIRGQNTYLKINTDYWKEYQSSLDGALLSFDTFTTLGKSQDVDWSKMFITSNLSDATQQEIKNAQKLVQTFNSLKSLLTDLKDMASTLWNGVLKPIINSGITPLILSITSGIVTLLDKTGLLKATLISISTIWTVNKITKIVTSLGSLGTMFTGLIAKIQDYNLQCALAKTKSQILQQTWASMTIAAASVSISVLQIVKNWDEMSKKAKSLVVVIASITAGVASLAFAVYASTQQWAKAISVASGVIATGATVAAAVSTFKNGGIMENSQKFNGSGTMYALAGERGAEVVAKGSNGTGVLNVQQFTEAMLNALTIYGAAKGNVGGDVYFDSNKVGKVVASSSGFRDEISRRNNGITLK